MQPAGLPALRSPTRDRVTRAWLVACFLLSIAVNSRPEGASAPDQASSAAEDRARRQLQAGSRNLEAGLYDEALRDFRAAAEQAPGTAAAGDALLAVVQYQFAVARDWTAAAAANEVLLKQYTHTPASAHAHVIAGRLLALTGAGPDLARRANAWFGRVPILFPASPVVPEAEFYGAEAYRAAGLLDDALDRYRRVARRYAHSIWAGRARLGAARCLTSAGAPHDAMHEAQLVRLAWPAQAESRRALEWTTILFRLYVRPPAQAAFLAVTPIVERVDDRWGEVADLEATPSSGPLVATRKGLWRLDADKPTLVLAGRFDAATMTDSGGVFATSRGTLHRVGQPTVALAVPRPSDSPRTIEDVTAIAALHDDTLIVAEPDAGVVHRFSREGQYRGPFAKERADRLAMLETGELVALNRPSRTVSIVTPQGQVARKLPSRTAQYEIRDPVDVAADPLGHVYVFGRDELLIFAAQGHRFLRAVPLSCGGRSLRPRLATVDERGRLLVVDDRMSQLVACH